MNAARDGPSIRPHAPTRGVFETNDLDLGREFLNEVYGTTMHLRGPQHEQFMRHARNDFGSFRVNDVRMGMDADFEVDPLETLVVLQPRAGWIEHQWEETAEYIGPGDLAANCPPHRPYSARVHNADVESVELNQTLLARTAGFTEERPSAALHFLRTQPASPGLADQWRSAAAHVRDLLETRPDALNEPLVIGNMTRVLAERALAVFPNTGGPEPTSADGRDATPGAVRRAVGFIEDHANIDIDVVDIAAAARVTPRALQIAFARHHTTSPIGHVRGVRLDRAHFDLLAADSTVPAGAGAPTGVTVPSIAARWGFATPADFAAGYRHTYGVSPAETLAT